MAAPLSAGFIDYCWPLLFIEVSTIDHILLTFSNVCILYLCITHKIHVICLTLLR